MNVVDSSGWLEYFGDGANADFFAPAIEDETNLIVPTVCVAEVFKRVLVQRSIEEALQAAALMKQGNMVDFDYSLALLAAELGKELKLALADSIVLATARTFEATLWTQDADFESLEGVRFIKKP